jgi:uncharacterized CHY-type Zn-finger protein
MTTGFKCDVCKKLFPILEIGSTNVYKRKRILRCKSCTSSINHYLCHDGCDQDALNKRDNEQALRFILGRVKNHVEINAKKV